MLEDVREILLDQNNLLDNNQEVDWDQMNELLDYVLVRMKEHPDHIGDIGPILNDLLDKLSQYRDNLKSDIFKMNERIRTINAYNQIKVS